MLFLLCVLFSSLVAIDCRNPTRTLTPRSTAQGVRTQASRLLTGFLLSVPVLLNPLSVHQVLARQDFMSPEAEGAAGGRFRGVKPSMSAPNVGKVKATPSRGFQTKSGIRYFDFIEGTGKMPRYGQLVTFHYTTYYQPQDTSLPLEVIDSSYAHVRKEPFLQKHGNGRIVKGLDEAIHTMKVGGKRRVYIPQAVGYTDIGIGPLPEGYSQRKRLGYLMDFMNEGKGELVFDVELLQVRDDEFDQGYYEDEAYSPEDIRQAVLKNLKKKDPNFEEKILKID